MTSDEQTQRIRRGIAQLGAEHEPPAGWEERVLSEVQRPRRYALTPCRLALAALVVYAAMSTAAAVVLAVRLQEADRAVSVMLHAIENMGWCPRDGASVAR